MRQFHLPIERFIPFCLNRYLMYINGENVYLIDRENNIYEVKNLKFPRRKELNKCIKSTLLDGELVLDADPENSNVNIPRYLVYDIIRFEDFDIGKRKLEIRFECIKNEIINSRNEAMKQGLIDRTKEPFGVRFKEFYPISATQKLLSDKFKSQITHGMDGLIYEPADDDDFYTAGIARNSLKWKPPSLNSIDFRLLINDRNNQFGDLYVGRGTEPFASIRLTNELRSLHDKIIECAWVNDEWQLLRERTDKTYPNAYKTAISIIDSIKYPVTEEILLDLINKVVAK